MKSSRIIFIAWLFFCHLTTEAQITSDSVMYQRDSAVVPDTDPTVLFFQENEKIPAGSLAKTILVTKSKKTISLASFLKSQDMVQYGDHAIADLDSDGKKELVITNYTGGAHCCDEIYIYKNIAPNKYQYVTKMFGGHTIITPRRVFLYSLDEQFGYFFTCYACALEDTADEAPLKVSRIPIKYKSGKVTVVPGDIELRSKINDNLGKLGEMPYEKIDADLGQDSGIRKEFAFNLARFYYSFGRNLTETQKLFNKYYKFPDAKKVWAAFAKQLQYMHADNDF
jgi:hypothetical protein